MPLDRRAEADLRVRSAATVAAYAGTLWREVTGDVEDQLGQALGIRIDLAVTVIRYDGHVGGDGTVACVQCRHLRLAFAVGPQGQVRHTARRDHGGIEHI